MPVERDRAHRAVVAFQSLAQRFSSFLGIEVRITNKWKAVLARELIGALAHEQDVRTFLHDRARGEHGIPDPAHRRDRSRAQRRSVHDRRVELVLPRRVVHRAAAGVEERIVLEGNHCLGDGVEAASASRQDFVSRVQRALQPLAIHRLLCVGQAAHDSGATVDCDCDSSRHYFLRAWPSAEQGFSVEQRSPITPTAWISISIPGRAKLVTVMSALPG